MTTTTPVSGVPPGLSTASANTRPGAGLQSLPRRLRDILALEDFEAAARRHLPRPLFGYVSGGVEDNVSMRSGRDAYADWALQPRVLVNSAQRSPAVELFDQRWAMPFGIAPMGISALIAYEGDLTLARAAEQAGIPMIVSGTSLIRLEELAQAAPRSAWFQAYLPGETLAIEALIDRIVQAGFQTLVLTVDTPTSANRENLVRVGFSTPLRPSLRLAWDGMVRPHWLLGTLARTLWTRGMPHFENSRATRGAPVISRDAVRQFGLRDHLSWDHVALIRRRWAGRLVIKGILCAADARLAAEHGADGIIVSNHGGRQLDHAVAPLRVLPEIVQAKGAMKVMIDSGIRRGTDVLKALALGADFAFAGRPFLYAAAVGGQPGVAHAVRLLGDEVLRDMALLGVPSLARLGPEHLVRCR